MHPTRTLTFCCLALMALAALSKQAFASSSATVGLCAGPGNHYTTIQTAVNAPGVTTVEVCPGTYPEQVTITQNLTLKGIASGTSDAAVVVVPAGGLVTNGLRTFLALQQPRRFLSKVRRSLFPISPWMAPTTG